jgi:hypothetical protein
MPKHFKNPKILLLNVELELKSEKENAEVIYIFSAFLYIDIRISRCTYRTTTLSFLHHYGCVPAIGSH